MMLARILVILLVFALAKRSDAQARVSVAGGEVTRTTRGAEVSRLSTHIPGVQVEKRARLRVSGDSAQRIAMVDYDWRGRVSSVEIDEEDARLFWDVKIVPDTSDVTIVRYRVDATSGGILGIREFSGIRGLVDRRP